MQLFFGISFFCFQVPWLATFFSFYQFWNLDQKQLYLIFIIIISIISFHKFRLKLSPKIQMKSICMKISYQTQEELMIFWITITCPLLTIKTKAEQEMLHISHQKIVSLTRLDYKGTIEFPKLLTILPHWILLMNKTSLWRLFNQFILMFTL